MRFDDRVEYGSDLHWLDVDSWPLAATDEYPWEHGVALFGSGRDAMRVLFAWGAREHGWRRVWLPSYYCQDVPESLHELSALGVELRAYLDGPDRQEPERRA